jgi:dipeptidyl aminopeptidase/acylaminoacyl peptidase
MDPQWGKSGFRADPAVLWTEAGRLFVVGHPYDQARFIESRTIAQLNPGAAPEERFQRGRNLAVVEKGLERLWFANYLTDSSAFFGQKYPEVTLLSFWDGEEVREFDRAWKYVGFWGNAGRLLYSVRRGEGQPSELTIYDADDGSQKVIAQSPDDYRYLFLSRDGGTALTSQASETVGRLVPYYATEDEQWQLKPLVTDRSGNARTLPSGWMRLASDGSLVAHVGETGIILYSLKD